MAPVGVAPLPSTPVSPPATPVGDKQNFTLENIDIAQPTGSLKAARVEVEGSAVSRAELEHLLDGNSGEPIVDRLRRISVDRIRIPQLTTVQNTAGGAKTTLYRDLVLDGIGSGAIAHMQVGGGAYTEAGGATESTFGRGEASDLSPALIVSLTTDTGGEGGRLFSAFSLDNLETGDNASGKVSIAHIALGPVTARTPPGGFASTFAIASADTPTDDKLAERRQAEALLRLMNAVAIGPVELTGLKTVAADGGTGEIQSLAYGLDAGGHDVFNLKGLRAGDADGRLTIGDVSMSGIDVKKTASLFVQFAFGPSDQVGALLAGITPNDVKLHVGQVTFDMLPDATAKALAKTPHEPTVSIAAIDLGATYASDGSNTGQLAIRDVAAPLLRGGPFQPLAELGYDKFVGSMSVSNAYDIAKHELAFKDFALSAPGMGQISITGLVGNVVPHPGGIGQQASSEALARMEFRRMDVEVRDEGLLGRFMAQQAKRERKPEAQVRQAYAGQASLLTSMMLAGSPDTKRLSAALARFVEKAGRLRVGVRPKDGDALPIAALMSATEPSEVLSRLRIDAASE